ncbi:hypothetical protein ACFOLG_03975 [Vogesella facilis]|uniref:Uncharacterized protein n=1 Tax=Vogesella facilis TaxID=1655232 RepID=A0ABV7REN4_9NEIS
MATVNSNYNASSVSDVGRSLQLERQQQERQRLQSDQAATEAARQANMRQGETVQTAQAVRDSDSAAAVRNGTSSQSTRQLEDSLQAQLLNARAAQASTDSRPAASQQNADQPSDESRRDSQAGNRQNTTQPTPQQDTSRAELNAYSQQAAVAQYQSSQSLLQDAGPGTVRTSV